jgi:allophanate hydrolase subunit 2
VLEIVKPGPSTSVRGGPVRGRAQLGFSLGGAADFRSLRHANRVVGNADGARGLEIVLGGAAVRALAPMDVAIVGASIVETRHLHEGERLDIAPVDVGLRVYLAVAGGIDEIDGRELARGDRVKLANAPRASVPLERAIGVVRFDPVELRVVDGPQAARFSRDALDVTFTVARDSDRRGVRLDGARVDGGHEILTEGVNHGAIQIPPSGQPIILGVDRTSTGGYAKIANVIADDRWLIGQLRPGARVRLVRR